MFITVIGLIGAALCVVAYMLLSLERINTKGPVYFIMNAVGSTFLLIAIAADFDGGDMGGIIMETAWILISLFGMVKAIKGNRKVEGSVG